MWMSAVDPQTPLSVQVALSLCKQSLPSFTSINEASIDLEALVCHLGSHLQKLVDDNLMRQHNCIEINQGYFTLENGMSVFINLWC